MRSRILGTTLLVAMGLAGLAATPVSAKEPDPVIDPNTLRSSSAVIEYLESVDAQIHWYFGVAQQAKLDAARVHTYQHASHGGGGGSFGGVVGECSGFSVPDYIIQRESGGNPNAYNPSSGAVGCSQTLLSHYTRGSCQGLDPHTIDGQRQCTAILSNNGTNLQPWAQTR